MKSPIRVILPAFAAICISACSSSSVELGKAELVMDTFPDSALHILQKIDPNQFVSQSKKALYALLMSQALDKNDIKVESDSLIKTATNYYSGRDPEKAGYAWFYSARCANNLENADEQANALLKALEFAEQTCNFKLRGLIYGDKAIMYKKQQQFDSSICYFKRAFHSFSQTNDQRNSAIALLNIGDDYSNSSRLDSAQNYYHRAEKIIRRTHDTLLLSTIYRNLGNIYLKTRKFDIARQYFDKVPLTHIGIYDSNKWLLTAYAFAEAGNTDSARHYLNKITDLQNMASNYYSLWETIYEKEGNLKKALHYAQKASVAKDSLYKSKLSVSFAGFEKRYKYRNLQLVNKELIIRNKQNKIFLLAALTILSLIIIAFLIWLIRAKNRQVKDQQQLLANEKKLVEKEKENNALLEKQVKMQQILLSRMEQFRKLSVKRPFNVESHGNLQNSLEELITCIDLEYNDISTRLANQFNELTNRDIQVCCLLIAGFDSGMIATLLDIKLESINKQRYRIRTKLGLKNSENLTDFLESF